MLGPKRMDVVDWQDSPLPIGSRRRVHGHSLPTALIGILGTLLLHAMLIRGLSFGGRLHRPNPPETQEFANARSKSSDENEKLVLLSLSSNTGASATIAQPRISSLPDLSKTKISSTIDADPPEFLGLETLALSEDKPGNTAAGGADGTEQARLYGIYTGQIQARIARVWRRPRTPVNEDNPATDPSESFQCEARIVQDAKGNIQEILLPRCNGSLVWQHSLVAAIQHASPLPAPPSEKVFSTSINLEFVGLNYVAGALEDEYESERRTLVGAQ
jgi:hypothetical protein